MSKILYPVGTPVTVRKSPETEGLIVTDYKKGEKYPYRVGFYEGDKVTVAGKTKFSVKGLKRYNPTQAKVAQEVSTPDVASPKQVSPVTHDVYTKEEVDTLLAQQYQDLLTLLATVDETAFKAFQKANRIAKVVDTNFCTVARQFKSLNHDDD